MVAGMTTLLMVLIVAVPVLLFIAALVSIIRADLSGMGRFLWIVVSLAFPLAGPIVWFIVGRRIYV